MDYFVVIMDIQSLISGAVGGAVFGALVNLFGNAYLKHQEYNFEYKKYIVSKRKAAYEGIEKLLGRFSMKKQLREISRPLHEIFFSTPEHPYPLYEFHLDLAKTFDAPFWVSDDLLKLIMVLNKSITDAVVEYKKDETEENLRLIGMARYEEFDQLRRTINKQYLNDIKSLAEVKKFMKEKTIL